MDSIIFNGIDENILLKKYLKNHVIMLLSC